MKFNWDLIMQPNTVVHCDTEDKANELLSEATKENKAYYGISYWKDYKQDTCYNISKNQYCGLSYFKDNNFTILSFDDILIKEERKMKIKYDLQVFHNVVLFKVLEMEEKYRDKDVLFKCDNGFYIRSVSFPQITENTIKDRGIDVTKDNIVTQIKFNTNQEAQEYTEKVRFALEEWNNYVEVMEIEINLDWFEEGKYFKNDGTYSMLFGCGSGSKNILIYDNDIIMKAYWIDSRIPLDKTIIMFNRDCELLNIPFRIKGGN